MTEGNKYRLPSMIEVTRRILTLIASCAIVMGLTASPVESKEVADSSIWQIDYLPGQVSSGSRVYLSKDALKICTDGSFEVTAKAPAWTATVINKKRKLLCELTAEKWMKQGFFLDPPDPKEYMNPNRAATREKVNFRGLQAQKLTWDTIESDQFYRYRSKPQKCVIELISTTSGVIPATEMQLELLSIWYGIPNLTGIPLFWQNVMAKEKTQRLKVSNVSKVTASSVSFKPASGCKRELSMMKIIDNKFSRTLTDFIEVEEELEPVNKKVKTK
jgi:hypothetical protein